MWEIAWQEWSGSGRLVSKRRAFKTEAALDRFLVKLEEKDSFHCIIGYRNP